MGAPVFFLIAGEASGDVLGARLMRALRAKMGDQVRFMGIGGPMMQAEGLDLLFPHTELMHFGIFEVLRHIPRLLRRIHQTAQAVLIAKPLALITIDSPDFCFRVAKKVKKGRKFGWLDWRSKSFFTFRPTLPKAEPTIALIHYVAPSVWAWRPGRAKKIAKFLDHLLAVLPFEPPYFTKEGLGCTFVGHSLVEGGANKGNGIAFREERGIDPNDLLLTVLPGSRTGEITRLLPVFKKTVRALQDKHANIHIAVPVVPHLKERIVSEIETWGVHAHIVEGEKDKYDAFAASTAALACSGTVALELALAKVPAVIAYKLNPLTFHLFKPFIRVRFANLVNIMHDRDAVPEFIQGNCTPENLTEAVDRLLTDKGARKQQIADLEATAGWLGLGKFVPSERAAETIMRVIAPPSVLQVLPALVTGGVERGTVETTAALVKAGFRAYVASEGGPMVREIEAAGGVHIPLPLASKNPITMYANVARLASLIKKNKIDIVHARSRAPAWSAYLAAKKADALFITTFHNAYKAQNYLKRLYNSVMGKGQNVIAISDFVADYAVKTYGVDRNSLHVVPRGVDIDTFDPEKVDSSRVNALKNEWYLHTDKPLILMPGRLTRWKGQVVLINALELLKRRDFVCVIVGGGRDTPYGKEVAAEIKKAGLENNVFLFDTCRDMAAAYMLADLVVVPSTRPEGFGRVVIEAQAMGVPVIATNHGGAKETVIQGKTGWLTEPGDTKALAQTLDAVLSLPSEVKESISKRAIAHIRACYTIEAMTSKTLEIYKELLLQKSRACR